MRSACVFLVVLLTGAVCAQDGHYENLKVLPKDIGKERLTGIMKSWSQALGVRCNFCHVGEPNAPLSSYDFASDEKDHKGITRQMVEMVKAINNDYLSKVDKDAGISCRTCHHGLASPRTLAEALNRTLERKGIDEAIAAYGKLKDRFYGSDSYDFSEASLRQLATVLTSKGKKAEAVKFLDLNLKQFPKSAETHFQLGDLLADTGDKPGAVDHFKQALALDPENQEAKARLEQLK